MKDVYNGEWTIPAYTAMCLWEEYVTSEDGEYPYLENFVRSHGVNATRDLVLGWVELCDMAWLVAAAHGYDEAFDWDFVPMFIRLAIADPKASGEDIGKAILDGWKYEQETRKGAKK